MANVVFSEQRGLNGEYYFTDQLPPVYLELQANLNSATNLQVSLNFVAAEFSTQLVGGGNVTAKLVPSSVYIRSALYSASTVLADLSDNVIIYAALQSGSTLNATLSVSGTTTRDVFATLMSSSSVVAKLYSSVSTIPKSAKVRAVPYDSDTLQLTRYRGDTYADAFLVFDDKTGLTLDITGCQFKLSLAKVKNPKLPEQIVYTLYGDVDNPVSGLVYFAPSEGQSDIVGYFYYDVEMTDSKGIVKTLISSSYIYKQDITP